MADDPEQNEWENRIQPARQRLMRSQNSVVHSYVRFMNRTQRFVDVYWLTYHGKRQKYTTLKPGSAYKINTYVSHPWIFRDAETKAKLVVNSEEVYFPRPWNEGAKIEGPVVPCHVTEYIIIPVYSLKDRAIQIVRSQLRAPEDAYLLDIPQTLRTAIAEFTT
ncbi:von Hippel-Lindau disease tumor suppressor-like isoform X1 [Macrobrachium nipponense]|uniref:von Hippel-Lindau disease tumor suppressor-like isoform X1 n=1 Tax=Macrobrachium nipponense TaxID=159736 RepID=UPI0030C81618